jgi:uncharacterized protein YjbJ (UPF0337 family)
MTTDRIKGKANDIIGTGKEKAGEATNDEELEAEGKAQGVVGKAKEAVEDIKDKVT